MKLTQPQSALLSKVAMARGQSYTTSGHYAPARKLVDLGLCEFQDRPFGGKALCLTDAGREYLVANGRAM